jgi:hypothetical protein
LQRPETISFLAKEMCSKLSMIDSRSMGALIMPVAFDTVRQLALSLDNVVEGTSYGTPAFKVGGKLFARLHQDGESLVLAMNSDQRESLMAANPDAFYVTDHYRGYEWILVRLARVKHDELWDLIQVAWRLRAPKKRAASPRRPGK